MIDHLYRCAESQHDVRYDVDWIVQRTLALQHPHVLASFSSNSELFLNTNTNIHKFLDAKHEDSSLASLGSASRLQQTLPPSVSITPVFKRKSADVSNGDSKKQKDGPGTAGITIFKETSITPKECAPPWSLGCVYRCAICGVKFQVFFCIKIFLA